MQQGNNASLNAIEVAKNTEPFQLNDATVLGEIPQNVLEISLSLGFGRSEQDKRWPARQMTWVQLVGTLSNHKVGPKEGTAFLQGSAIENTRRAQAIDALYIMGLDVDSGIHFQWAVDRVKELGLSAVIYTTHSHMKPETFILENSFAQFARRNKLDQFPTLETMKRYLREERYWEEWVVDTVSINEETEHRVKGKGYVLQHAPMPKFRIIFPLSDAYRIAKQRMSQADTIDLWKSKLVGLSKSIGLPIDEACLDPSRLFYMPRHGEGKPFQVVVTGGLALDFDAVLEGRTKGQKTAADNVFTEAAKDLGAVSGGSLKRWAATTADKFDICRLFREVASDRIRTEQSDSKLSVDCPFDAFHSNAGDEGDRGAWVQSPGSEANAETFTFACSHNGCKKRDRLEMVAEAIDKGWFTHDDLKDERFVIPGIGKREETPEQSLARLKKEIEDTFNRNTPASAIDALFEQLAVVDASPAQRAEIVEIVADKLEVKKPAERLKLTRLYDRILKKVEEKRQRQKRAEAKEKATEEKTKESGGKPLLAPDSDGYIPCVDAAFKRLLEINETEQCYFNMGGQKIVMHKGVDGTVASVPLGKDAMLTELDHACAWVEWSDDSFTSIECPARVANDIISYRKRDFPRLDRCVSAPFFSAEGDLVDKPGYHAASKVYYSPPKGFELPPIPDNPTDADVRRARALIDDNVFIDFPFDDGKERGGASSKAHAWALLLVGFSRELIPGHVPIYFWTKPQAGTGASLGVEVITIIASGSPAPIQVEKGTDEEQRKALTAFLLSGGQFHFTDNINKKLAGSAMAIAATSAYWQDRILGKSEMANLPVRCAFIAAGNNVSLSDEIARRCLPIRLDAKRDPKKGRTFKHDDLPKWVRENRAELVAACLTIIKAWVQRGKPAWTGTDKLASYEPYSEVMGGILETAGIKGFLGNLDVAQEGSSPEHDAEIAFVSTWLSEHGEVFRPVGDPDRFVNGKTDSLVTIIEENEIDITLHGLTGAAKAVSLSKWLKKKLNTVWDIGGTEVRLENEKNTNTNSMNWRIKVLTKATPPVFEFSDDDPDAHPSHDWLSAEAYLDALEAERV